MSNGARLQCGAISEDLLGTLAQQIAPRLRAGDFLALRGDLGAGKTAFARHLIRALVENSGEEVPSPSFALVQPYECRRFPIHHFDFYRLSGGADTLELGLDDALKSGLVIAEWPERLGEDIPADRLEIILEETGDPLLRDVTLEGIGAWAARLERFIAIKHFIAKAGWQDAQPKYLMGDASTRAYTRLIGEGKSAILMDSPKMPDGPPVRNGLPYSQIAHLAEDVKPFVAIANALRAAQLAAPEIYAADLEHGLLLIEDFGDETFTAIAARGGDLLPLYRLAVDALLTLRQHQPPAHMPVNGASHSLPAYDRDALTIETELLTDWFLPAIQGTEPAATVREEFNRLWNAQFDWLLTQPTGWVLRDFHSPNLMLRPSETGLQRLGIIDFQDALRGHPAYDLMSLLQDARLDLPDGLEAELFASYCESAAKADPGFDRSAFERAYHLLGAQRNTKILGIFARLARRDGKRAYLQHMPRIARYLRADLAHPALADLRGWYERALPEHIEELAARF